MIVPVFKDDAAQVQGAEGQKWKHEVDAEKAEPQKAERLDLAGKATPD
jgi:hypothetical protein